VYCFASWGGLGGYLPFAGDPDDDDDDDDETTTTSTDVTSRQLVEMNPATGDMFPTLVLVLIIGAISIHVICNIVFYCIYMFSIRKDPDFSYWRTLHGYACFFVPFMSLFFSFHFIRIIYSKLCGIKGCKAIFTKKEHMYVPLIRLTYVHILCVCFPMIAAQVIILLHYPWSNIIWMMALDSLCVTLFLILFGFLDIRKMEKELNEEDIESKLGLTSRRNEEIADLINLFPTVDLNREKTPRKRQVTPIESRNGTPLYVPKRVYKHKSPEKIRGRSNSEDHINVETGPAPDIIVAAKHSRRRSIPLAAGEEVEINPEIFDTDEDVPRIVNEPADEESTLIKLPKRKEPLNSSLDDTRLDDTIIEEPERDYSVAIVESKDAVARQLVQRYRPFDMTAADEEVTEIVAFTEQNSEESEDEEEEAEYEELVNPV